MQDTLLTTKLYIPPIRSELVSRTRLTTQLNAGLQRKMTLVSAPAGFGKTTLIAEWITSSERPTGWLQLDEGDNDPTRFLTYLVAALERIAPGIGQGISGALHSPQPPSSESILTTLLNDIATRSDQLMLVLDDYHLIESEAVDDALTFLLDHLPPQMHLVMATRHDPQLPLARLRGRGQLNELRAADLRFTSAEAAEFLNQGMKFDLAAEDVAALESRTEGWITGLQLAAISLQGSKDSTRFIEAFTGSHRYILDYLIEEVLEQQPERMQTFLLQTAILNQLAGPLCDALTGLDNGQQTLEYLEQANIFIVSLDNERRWYRYHHLFGDLLRQRLRQVQPDTIPTLHTRASRWFIGKGRYHEAIGHLLAAKDFSGAARLIKEIALDTVQRGEHTTVGAWINSFPEDSVKKQPYLCTLHAWALQLTGQLESAEARLNYAESALDNPEYQKDDDTDLILGLIHSHKSYLSFMRGEQEKVISYAHQALEQLPTSAVLIRAQTALYLGIAYRFRGQLHKALDVYNEVLPTTQRMGGQSIAVLCYLHLGDLHAQMAHLHQAEELYTKGLQHTERHFGHSDVPFCGYAYVSIGRILRQRNQLDQAYHFTAKGVSLCQDWNVTDILALSYIELAYISEALGKDDQAQASMQKAIHLYSDVSPWASKYASAHEASLELLRGDIDAAARWAQGNDLVIGGDFEFHRAIEYTAMARVMLAQHQFAQAQRLVGQIHQLAVETGERQSELEALILLALLFNVQDDLEQGLVCLRNALSIAEPEGYIRVFVDEGPPMAALLYEALSRDIMPDYVRQLLAAFPTGEVEPTEPSEPQVSGDDWIEPLSERELEVLELVADGLTNREIAEKLFLSTQTVKVHTRNIYSKLDVHNRTEAVARGRALGILPVL